MSNTQKLSQAQARKIKIHEQQRNKSVKRKQLQTANKKAKRGGKEKRVRQKNLRPHDIDLDHLDEWEEAVGWDEELLSTQERIMPIGEHERQRDLERALFRSQTDGADDDDYADERAYDALIDETTAGSVIEVSSGLCRVAIAEGTLLCTIRQGLREIETGFTNVVAVGDDVRILALDDENGVVEQVLPRRTMLARPDIYHSHLRQLLVANADQLLIVASWREPTIWFELIDRYLIAAERNNLPVVLCINKVDLAEERQACSRAIQPYQDLGVETVLTSAESGEGIAILRSLLQGKTSVLTGLSGVGKSSLLSVVEPGLNLRVGEVGGRKQGRREEGRHTTTQSNWFALAAGGAVIDTPGIREFGLSGLYKDELLNYFPEIAKVAPHCRFRNCTHINEAGCAVQEAMQHDRIAESRYHSYECIYPTLS